MPPYVAWLIFASFLIGDPFFISLRKLHVMELTVFCSEEDHSASSPADIGRVIAQVGIIRLSNWDSEDNIKEATGKNSN